MQPIIWPLLGRSTSEWKRPIPLNFASYVKPGKVLDPTRILVGSTSNFGEPLSDLNQLPGSFLSIDPTSDQQAFYRRVFENHFYFRSKKGLGANGTENGVSSVFFPFLLRRPTPYHPALRQVGRE